MHYIYVKEFNLSKTYQNKIFNIKFVLKIIMDLLNDKGKQIYYHLHYMIYNNVLIIISCFLKI